MAFFSDNYSKLSFPVGTNEQPGFRDAQRGALFSIAGHFSSRTEPAIVTMPTGSGKTAVLQASSLLLRPNRVLVLTPSRLVREQIADDFSTFGILRKLGAITEDAPAPRVFATAKRIVDPANWEAMREYDVVVATIPSVSPALNGMAIPPDDLFDLILVDEAHHSPAATWSRTLDFFPNAKIVLFTATPFRRDDREIRGRFVYTYDLKTAYTDGVFGHINYEPVPSAEGALNQLREDDILVARAAEERLRSDRNNGLDHLIMVRTDSRKRASELVHIYAEATNLRLKLIHGGHSLSYVKKTLSELTGNTLDGIICVNMLGEGFDMPRLKVAAVHSPHKSLAVTLQFIGRFARTAGERLGDATFLATKSGVEVETERLYTGGAIWSEIIPNLSEARVRREIEVRELYETFELNPATIPDLADLSLYTLSPYAHVKIFRLREPFDITAEPDFGHIMEQVFNRVSIDTQSSVYVTRSATKVPWTNDDKLIDIRYDLFIFVYDAESSLLFVCASQRADGLYRRIVTNLVGYAPRTLGLSYLNRALRELDNPKFFHVGMRNRQHSSLTESYRMLAGSHADEAIQPEDSRLYHRGHCFGSVLDEGVQTTIGLSSSSKIWSNRSLNFAELIAWCKKLATKIHDQRPTVTGSKLDLLQMGEIITEIPKRVLWAEWEKEIYIDPPIATFTDGGAIRSTSLSDFDILVDSSTNTEALLVFEFQDFRTEIRYRIGEDPFFSYSVGNGPLVELAVGRSTVDLVDYLNDAPLNLMLEDWSRLCGEEYFVGPPADFAPFDANLIHPIDWDSENVDVTLEYADRYGNVLDNSIQVYLSRALVTDENEVVYWDHGSGESADFIVIRRRVDGGVNVSLYHCKGSGASQAGNRVGDVYEVCGQAVKSAIWCDLPRLAARISSRANRRTGVAQFLKGSLDLLMEFAAIRTVWFEMVVVQPGISKENIEAKLGEVLASASHHLLRAGHQSLKVWGSK